MAPNRVDVTKQMNIPAGGNAATKKGRTTGAFDKILSDAVSKTDVKFSAHAQKRLQSRNVTMDDAHNARLSQAIEKAKDKGVDKSLVLMDDIALVVSARNRTVITAMSGQEAKDGVFTGIESAIIA